MNLSSRTIRRLGLRGLVTGLGLTLASAAPDQGNALAQGEELPGSILKGYVLLRPEGSSLTDGTLHIIVENVSKQDIPSRVVAELIQYHIPYEGRGERKYPFALGPFAFHEKNRYNIRIHMDSDSDGRKTPGDYSQLGINIFNGKSQVPPNTIFPTTLIRSQE